jgi:hypothetical protein
MIKNQAGANIDSASALSNINAISDTISKSPVLSKYNVGVRSLFQGTSGVNEPLLARYLEVTNPPGSLDDTNALIAELRALKDVQTAYAVTEASLPGPVPIPNRQALADSAIDASEKVRISPLFVDQQGYLLSAESGGLDVLYAQNQTGGLGDNVRVYDVEFSWQQLHEDLIENFPVIVGVPNTDPGYIFHGTAVAGVIGGDVNNFGVTGIAPNATFIGVTVNPVGTNPVYASSIANAIFAAADLAGLGDVILLEQQIAVSFNAPNRRPPDVTYIAVEFYPEVFDAIKLATYRGSVVVEAAGNGQNNGGNGLNFDDSVFVASRNAILGAVDLTHPNPFDPANPSSGAVIVGAGAGGFPPFRTQPARSRLDFSNYGRRLDVQAWGENIVTTGFLVPNNPDTCALGPGNPGPTQCYTRVFGGTSGASAIIAGVVASVQAIVKKANPPRKPLTSQQFIDLFRNPATGLAQTNDAGHPSTQRIGSLPDLSRLIPKALALNR